MRVLRTLGGRNIGKCRLRAHQHPLCRHCRTAVESLWSPSPCKTPKARCVLERVLGDVLRDLLRMHAEDRLLRASILDFRAKLENRCRVLPVYALIRASILDFRAKLENRCKVLPVYALLRASILDFRARLGNQCTIFPRFDPGAAVILDFKPRLGNRCRETPGNDLDAEGRCARLHPIVVAALKISPPSE